MTHSLKIDKLLTSAPERWSHVYWQVQPDFNLMVIESSFLERELVHVIKFRGKVDGDRIRLEAMEMNPEGRFVYWKLSDELV